jgi:hypothetical protein
MPSYQSGCLNTLLDTLGELDNRFNKVTECPEPVEECTGDTDVDINPLYCYFANETRFDLVGSKRLRIESLLQK